MPRVAPLALPLLLLGLVAAGPAAGASGDLALYPDRARLAAGIDLLYRAEYPRARALLEALAAEYPRHPAGPLFLALVDFAQLFEGDDPSPARERRFLAAIDTVLARARPLRETPATRAIADFYLGSAYGFRARHWGTLGKWWGAYRDGTRGRDLLAEALALDPTLVDANLGLGTYHVVADILPRYLKMIDWLLRIHGDRRRGFQELRLARQRGVLSRTEATFFLATLAVEFDGRYEQGLRLARELIARYPYSAAFRALEGRALMGLGEYESAEARLAALYLHDVWWRPRHRMRQSAFELGRLLVRRGAAAAGQALLGHHFAAAADRYTWYLPWAFDYLGAAADQLGDEPAARAAYRRAAALADRAGSRERAKRRLRERPSARQRVRERCIALARTRAGAAAALALVPELVEEGGRHALPAGERGVVAWTAGLAALRAGEPNQAATHFALAIRAGVTPELRGYCLLGRAAALAATGDTAAARRTYQAILDDATLAALHLRARDCVRLMRSAAASPPPPPPPAAGEAAQRPLRLEIDALGLDFLLAPAVQLELLGTRGGALVLPGRCGRFAATVPVPAGGLRYRLRVPGARSRLDPGHPRVRIEPARGVVSWLPAGRRRSPGLPDAAGVRPVAE